MSQSAKLIPDLYRTCLLLSLFILLCIHSVSSDEIYNKRENAKRGTFITNLASSLGRICKKASNVQIKSGRDIVELRESWDLVTREELDHEWEDCEEDSGDDMGCMVDILLICKSPFASKRLWLNILDENDNPPKFSKKRVHLSMPENTPRNSEWALDIANDPDSSENGVTGYSLSCENCDQDSKGTFQLIDDERRSTDGVILPKLVLKTELDHEEKDNYIFKISAFDADGNFFHHFLNFG